MKTPRLVHVFQEFAMPRRDPFKGHRFPRDVILLAVRWYCRYPLSYRDVLDLLAERGITVDVATIYRWVQKFGPEIRKRVFGQHRCWRGLQWHVPSRQIALQPPAGQRMRPTYE